MKHVNASVKIILCEKKIIVGILAHIFARISRYSKIAVDNLIIVCNKVISVTNKYCK